MPNFTIQEDSTATAPSSGEVPRDDPSLEPRNEEFENWSRGGTDADYTQPGEASDPAGGTGPSNKENVVPPSGTGNRMPR